ncbi:hypothetical protein BUE80_DR000745, partial [Diplocarpon rosae]
LPDGVSQYSSTVAFTVPLLSAPFCYFQRLFRAHPYTFKVLSFASKAKAGGLYKITSDQ